MYSAISVTGFYTICTNIFVFETPYSVSALFGNTLYYSILLYSVYCDIGFYSNKHLLHPRKSYFIVTSPYLDTMHVVVTNGNSIVYIARSTQYSLANTPKTDFLQHSLALYHLFLPHVCLPVSICLPASQSDSQPVY